MIDFSCGEPNIDEILKCAFGLTKADLKIMKFFLKKSTKSCTANYLSKRLKFQSTTTQKTVRKLFDKAVLLRTKKNLKKGGYVFHYNLNNRTKIHKDLSKTLKSWTSKVNTQIRKDLLL